MQFGEQAFGTLTGLQATDTGIGNVLQFSYSRLSDLITIYVSSNHNDNDFSKSGELLNKRLVVTTDGTSYDLGKPDIGAILLGGYEIKIDFINKELSDILKQTGQTKHFCFKWSDN
ncbi:hypothetical protein [Xenorhabdus griffiniae]|uniref:DUF7823 domain-containing protein n=1 Tax=Xenorhabdus griffiniae TaxID=351672 RepID=A0ABY9XFY5_9GAMM|nr:hypothetical protein [Xenorhabdus griffiniae]MBD1228475.1 hypothetical protein [Xenorhabdus griffiniae]MBE8589215.1 hypothetical protein [Xenorhabdus griffiniae]WMV71844.1 hypothetical protein QL128_17210 [Xenorhabdus griffiniae]WNH01521.1 hypothetical protein QL112_017215 [Xenorhabdus griffiniae]